MPRISPNKKPMAEINVVPYIDVTLVLLIIFMITAPLLQTGVDVDLPQAQTEPLGQNNTPPVIVSIHRNGDYFYTVGAGKDTLTSASNLLVQVKSILRQKPTTKILVRGDRAVNYGAVMAVMVALKKAGVKDVGMMTQTN